MSITRPHKNGHFSSSVSNQCLKFGHKKHTKTADNNVHCGFKTVLLHKY